MARDPILSLVRVGNWESLGIPRYECKEITHTSKSLQQLRHLLSTPARSTAPGTRVLTNTKELYPLCFPRTTWQTDINHVRCNKAWCHAMATGRSYGATLDATWEDDGRAGFIAAMLKGGGHVTQTIPRVRSIYEGH